MGDPYSIKSKETYQLRDGKYLFWTKILIASCIYMVVGLGLMVWSFLYRDFLTADDSGNVDSLVSLIALIDVIVRGCIIYTVSGITAVIICLIMRGKERQLMWHSEQQS